MIMLEAPAQPMLQQQPREELTFRSLQPGDYPALKAIHQELFPIDYDEQFFQKATTSADRLFSFAAVPISCSTGQPAPELIGFITARLMHAYECDPVDRHHLGLSSPVHSNTPVVYILTLGVTKTWQKRGVARMLLQHVHHRAQAMQWHAIFLHVITYNQAAINLYNSQAYRCVAFLKNFYLINSGRQLCPDQIQYDAYLYVLTLDDMTGNMHGVLGWQGAMAFNMAMAPLRNALGHFNTCIPWLCNGSQQRSPTPLPPTPMHTPTSQLTPQTSMTLLAPSPTSPPQISLPLPSLPDAAKTTPNWGSSPFHTSQQQSITWSQGRPSDPQLQLQQQQQGTTLLTLPTPYRRPMSEHQEQHPQYNNLNGQYTEGTYVLSRQHPSQGGSSPIPGHGLGSNGNGASSWGLPQTPGYATGPQKQAGEGMPGGMIWPAQPSLFQWLSRPTRS